MRARFRTLAGATVWLAAVSASTAALAQGASAEQLESLRADIARLERELERQVGRRDDGMAGLKAIELSLAESESRLASLGESIDAGSQRRDEIAAERDAATSRLAGEQDALAEQVRMSYMTGRQELVKLLLSQENPADFGRMLVYYDYLNRHRSGRIAAVDKEIGRLDELARETEAVTLELERLREAERAEATKLDRERAERATLVAELDASIQSAEDRIGRMRSEETELNETIARLARIVEGFPVSSDAPFSEQRGKLRWPVDGRIAARFGDFRESSGRVRWSGVVLEAEAGTEVSAVYNGRVIYSDWLTHMGLVLILDHGDGYWTLYGHNAALLREVGDWVIPGEVIAEVGNTGGQQGTGLYFGLLKDTEPVDPAGWIR
jgi:septal ring factor EnvC (AmiA/AmiB activator)